MGNPVCVVVGVGPGNGEAFARKFAEEGYAVALLSRSGDASLAESLGGGARAYACDAADVARLSAVLEQIAGEMGPPRVLLWNVGSANWGDIDQLTPADFRIGFELNVISAAAAVKAVLPAMRRAGEGQIIFSGATASLRGKPMTTAFAAAKAAQRSLAQSLARKLGPEGVHVSLLILDGRVLPDGPKDQAHLEPRDIAETVYFLTQQPKSAWTFELDLRPHNESW